MVDSEAVLNGLDHKGQSKLALAGSNERVMRQLSLHDHVMSHNCLVI